MTLLTKVEGFDGGEGKEGEESAIRFFKAHSHAFVFFDFSEESFDFFTKFVDGFIVDNGGFPVIAARNHRDIVVGHNVSAEFIRIIPFISNNKAFINITY